MEHPPIPDSSVRKVAAKTEYTAEFLEEKVRIVHDAVQKQLLDHYRDCFLRGGLNYHLEETDHEVTFAMHPHEIESDLKEAGASLEAHVVHLVGQINLDFFQTKPQRTIRVPRPVAQRYKEPIFYPIYVLKPEQWKRGQYRVEQDFEELVLHYEMSPSEALDYWMTVIRSRQAADWASMRGVDPEAVRKNVRQAKAKLGDEEKGSTYDVNNIDGVALDEAPEDTSHDPETGDLFMPTLEQAKERSGE